MIILQTGKEGEEEVSEDPIIGCPEMVHLFQDWTDTVVWLIHS